MLAGVMLDEFSMLNVRFLRFFWHFLRGVTLSHYFLGLRWDFCKFKDNLSMIPTKRSHIDGLHHVDTT